MNRGFDLPKKNIFGCGLALSLLVQIAGAHAQETTLYQFSGGSGGGNPPCGLISGGKGVPPASAVYYGVTENGGAGGSGTVYKVTTAGSEVVIYSFSGGSDGAFPRACPLRGSTGNLYGTTEAGGTSGLGVVFKVTTGGSESTLHSFAGGSDGAYPEASLIMDSSGNLYGTTEYGGANGLGTVFKVAPGGTESVLHAFAGSDGAYPLANLVMDKAGNLYGTTSEGGSSSNCNGGCGTVFKLAASGTETVLHSFSGSDGADPVAGLIMDGAGNLYGTTKEGGANGDGTVFGFLRVGKERLLHSFAGGSDGAYPVASVVEKLGILYGTTYEGGPSNFGTVFKIPAKGGPDTVLYSFTGGGDGGLPEGGVLDQSGVLFGTTFAGGKSGCNADQGCGVVFELMP